MNPLSHYPVLIHEVIHCFENLKISVFIDGTVGGGGHAEEILKNHPEIQHYLAIDQDPYALHLAKERLKPWASKVLFKHGNFSDFDDYLKENSFSNPDAILIDLGVSSMQLDQPERGFSFMKDGPLDMRMNPELSLTAKEIVNNWSEKELGEIFRNYGEEKQWRVAARTIVQRRKSHPLLTTFDLRQILNPVLTRYSKKGINPLTLVFQALRIAVNQELEKLEIFLSKALEFLTPGGRLAIISFHSLEDRIVKKDFRLAASDKWETSGLGGGLFQDKEPTVKLLNKKPIEASQEEIKKNPRSRSAKMRIAEKLPGFLTNSREIWLG